MNEQKLEFNWTYKDYELRACPKQLVRLDNEPNETIDLVKWDSNGNSKPYCFSLAYWRKNKDGYELYFVGDRPFKYIEPEDIEIIWKALQLAQKVLDDWFKLESMMEN